MKRFIAIFMTLCLVLGMSSVSVWAADEATWQEEPPIPVSRCNLVTCVVGNKIYALGGNGDLIGEKIYNDVYIYNTVTKIWSKGKDMPEKLNGFGAIAVGSKIYVMGGMREDRKTISSKTWIYDTQNDTWIEGVSMPKAKFYFGIAEAKNKIYIVCGAESYEDYSNTVEIYDIKSKKWTTGSSAEVAKGALGLVKVGNKLYTAGGCVKGTSNPIQIYDIEANSWTNVGNFGLYQSYVSLFEMDGKIYSMGGCSASTLLNIGHPSDNYVGVYDPATRVWGKGKEFNNGYRDRIGLAFVNGTIYLVGGRFGDHDVTNVVLSYKIKDVCDAKLSVLLNIDEQVQLSTSYNLENNKNYTWSSTNEAVATVDNNGKVTAVGVGDTDIYSVSADGTFKEYIPVKVVEGIADELRLAVHLKTSEKAKLYLADEPSQVKWSSMDESIATVSVDGQVTGVKKGLAIIKAELDGQTYQIYVRVNG